MIEKALFFSEKICEVLWHPPMELESSSSLVCFFGSNVWLISVEER